MKIERIAEPLVRLALVEDIGGGDITSEAVIPANLRATAHIVAREKGTVAGLDVARVVFSTVDNGIVFEPLLKDGDRFEAGSKLCRIEGSARSILTGERVALNFMQRMSGIATLTRAFVEEVAGTGAKITDTRKTTPVLRILEKYSVKMGGGVSHRFGLFDMYLIKGNHVRLAGGIRRALKSAGERKKDVPLEVEVRSLDELEQVLDANVDRIMLDNMTVEDMKKAVKIIKNKKDRKIPEIEASGGVTLKNVKSVAGTGVDLISIGALTHSVKAIDLALEVGK